MNPSSPPLIQRSQALDALRGWAVFLMIFSGVIPFDGSLPPWMYHAQNPPPSHGFNPDISGLTWVDLVFPFFLFALGAAIPLAFSRLMAKGWRFDQLIFVILKRGFFLGTFAIFLQQIRPHILNSEEIPEKWYLALIGFFTLWLMYGRWPKFIPQWLGLLLTLGGWTYGIIFLSHLQYPNGSGFSLNRSDIILIVLTNMAVWGSLIWLFTRAHFGLRLGILGVIMALRLSATTSGWVADIWSFSPAPWIFRFEYLKYLLIVIPGTLAGDFLNRWLQNAADDHQPRKWSNFHFLLLLFSILLIFIIVLVGLQSRQSFNTTLLTLIIGGAGVLLVNLPAPEIPQENLLQKLYLWGFYWLILGLALEPLQGGIKKDPTTWSYLLITLGLSYLFLIALIILVDHFQQKIWMQPIIDLGKNPMIGYVAFANFLLPILKLTGWQTSLVAITPTPLLAVLRALTYTILITLFVSLVTQLKIYWRT